MSTFNKLARLLEVRRLRNRLITRGLAAVYRVSLARGPDGAGAINGPRPAAEPAPGGRGWVARLRSGAPGTSSGIECPRSAEGADRAAEQRRRRLAVLFWAAPTAALFLVVLCTWTGPFGDRMSLGGDDGHLYYMDPQAWLRNAPLTTLDAGILGYNSRVYMVPFLLVLRGIQLTGLNVQGAAMGLLVGLGWAGTAALVLCALDRRDGSARAAAAVAGLVAVLAPTVASTQYLHLLLGVYWIALLPWLLLITVRHQQTGGRRYLVAAVAATALGAPAIAQAPWTIGVMPMMIGGFAVLAVSRTFRVHLGRLASFLGVVILANAWWLVPTAVAFGGAQAAASTATSAAGADDAYNLIRTLAPVQAPLEALALLQSHRQHVAFDSIALEVDRMPRALWPLGVVPAATVVVALLLAVWRRRPSQRLLAGCVGLVVVNLFFITVRLFGLGLGLAIHRGLLRALPPFAGVRNFYDRFAIPFALSMALAFGVALADLLWKATSDTQWTAAILLCTAMLVYGYPGLVGQQVRLPHYPAFPQNRMIDGLPPDYLRMLERLDREPPGSVLTVPLLIPNWTTVAEPRASGAYVGISPMVHLTGRSEYNGLDSFNSSAAPQLRQVVEQAVLGGDAKALAAIVSELAVQWVAVQRDEGPESSSYRVGVNRDRSVARPLQQQLLDMVAPEVVGTYGTYELRKVRAEVRRPLLGLAPREVLTARSDYLTARAAGAEEPRGTCAYRDVPLRRVARSGTRYQAAFGPLPDGCAIVLRTAFDGAWSAVAGVAGKEVSLRGQRALGFANGWLLPPGTTTVKVQYERQRLLGRSAALSATLLPFAAAAGVQSWRRRRRRVSAAAAPAQGGEL